MVEVSLDSMMQSSPNFAGRWSDAYYSNKMCLVPRFYLMCSHMHVLPCADIYIYFFYERFAMAWV